MSEKEICLNVRLIMVSDLIKKLFLRASVPETLPGPKSKLRSARENGTAHYTPINGAGVEWRRI
jgi:hypothetical protein